MSRMDTARRWALAGFGLLLLAAGQAAMAEPYLAVRQDLKCVACHVNPTGGGLRNDFGIAFAKTGLPAHTVDKAEVWTGKVAELVRLGGDLRTGWSNTEIPNQDSQHEFALDQMRVYGEVTVIADKLGVYLDQLVAPGNSQTQEAYVRYGNQNNGWYAKGGKFYLPFGWRLQDNTSFVRQTSGINMAAPDTGFEVGYENSRWSAQLAVANGSGNSGTGSGHQATAQAILLQSNWRVGVAASFTDSEAGDRRMGGLFAGLHTGPLAWLGEVDLVKDEGFAAGTRTLGAALGEVNWSIRTGHNLKLTAEFFEPDRDVDEDEQNRYSLVYELTPLPFVQLRVGHRYYDGIPQSDVQNRRFTFIELHGFF